MNDHFNPHENPAPPRPTQPGIHHLLANLFGRRQNPAIGSVPRGKLERLAQCFVAAVLQVTIDVRTVTRLIRVFENESMFLRHAL
jgi:hypothetical protein